jgi:uncharacterized protein YuzE
MKITYDREARAVYAWLRTTKHARTQALDPCVNVDFDSDGNVIGVEILDADTPHIEEFYK